MRVSELIEYLKQLDPSAVVYIESIETTESVGYRSAELVRAENIRTHPGQVVIQK